MRLGKVIEVIGTPLRWANERPSRYERKGGQPVDYTATQTSVKVYRSAGQAKRGMEQMAKQGWRVVAQSASSPHGWTKTVVTFERGGRR